MQGALIGLAGQAVSGIASAINNKRQQQAADAEAARQRAYYDAKANENPLARSENQHLLGQYDRQAQQQIENARGVAAITGATPEYGLAVQKAVAEGRADLMGNMSADASRRADFFNQKGEQAAHQKFLDDQERKAARNQTYANLAANAASAAGAIMDSYSGFAKSPSQQNNNQQNAQKLASGGATKPAQSPKLVSPYDVSQSANYLPQADGTYKGKDGMTYIFDAPSQSYKLYFPK